MFSICGSTQTLEWTHLESTSKIMSIDVENYLFGYNLAILKFVKRPPASPSGGPSAYSNLCPEENASHHDLCFEI